MQASARADYALRAAIELAAASGSHVSGEQLARAQNIPGKFIETILTQLRRTGLVRSQRGPDGGFWLARPASEISLADIIRAVDGQFPSARGEPPEERDLPRARRAAAAGVDRAARFRADRPGDRHARRHRVRRAVVTRQTPLSSGDGRSGLASCGPGRALSPLA